MNYPDKRLKPVENMQELASVCGTSPHAIRHNLKSLLKVLSEEELNQMYIHFKQEKRWND